MDAVQRAERQLRCQYLPGRRQAAALNLLLAKQIAELLAKRRRNVLAGQRVGDVGGQETHLRSAIEAAALEFQAVERLLLGKADHGVGDLDFAAGSALLGLQDLENFRL